MSAFPDGCRPKHGKIEIRYTVAGKRKSELLDLPQDEDGFARAASIRKTRLLAWVAPKEFPSLRETMERYFAGANLERSTEASYRSVLRRYWLPNIGALPVNEIHYARLREIDARTAWSSGKTRNSALVALSQVFSHCLNEDLIDENPVRKFKWSSVQRRTVRAYTTEERDRILAHMNGDSLSDLFAHLAFHTGMRTGEILGLRWRHWKRERGERALLVEGSVVRRQVKATTKTSKARWISLTNAANEALWRRHAVSHHDSEDDFIFLLDGALVAEGTRFLEDMRAATLSVGVPWYGGAHSPYPWRHTYASIALTAGAKPAFIAKQLGHSISTLERVYARWLQREDQVEIEKIERAA